MLAVSSIISTSSDKNERQEQNYSSEEFPDLLESIDFDDLFVGINDGDVLPHLEMDSDIFAEFSSVTTAGDESEMNASECCEKVGDNSRKDEDDKVSDSRWSTREDESVVINPVSKDRDDKVKKSSSTQVKSNNNGNSNHGKRKVKVDWTPELHRRFVQAVEQLGVDKAVPSRILELMGIDCLTRHNIASHLQKYRSHRKHLLAREAEAAKWSHRPQMYGAAGGGGGGGGGKTSTWRAPTMGFPPINHHFRPLHVWGHPSMNHPIMYIWPKQPPHTWPPPDPSYWHHHQLQKRLPIPGTACFPQPLAAPRFGAGPVPGIPPHALYKAEPVSIGVPPRHSVPIPPSFDFHPSTESIDATIGDVLSKPWLPLPLGLKPPSHDGVIGQLQRQGVASIPPSCA